MVGFNIRSLLVAIIPIVPCEKAAPEVISKNT